MIKCVANRKKIKTDTHIQTKQNKTHSLYAKFSQQQKNYSSPSLKTDQNIHPPTRNIYFEDFFETQTEILLVFTMF